MQFIRPPNDREDIESQLRHLANSSDRLRATRGRMLLRLVEQLQNSGPTPQALALLVSNELLISIAYPGRAVRVWVDWQDYGKTVDGLPTMHYRIQMNTQDMVLSRDERASSPADAERAILQLLS
jgi:hypothetical protein